MPEQIKLTDIRLAAMNLLSMREHSMCELARKLGGKFPVPELIEQVIIDLRNQYLQSDERFAEAFIRMRQGQGKGSALIKMELREKGVAPYLISELINESDAVWAELARRVLLKRFHTAPLDGKDKARQMRFLQSRGFVSRHIQAAFKDLYDGI